MANEQILQETAEHLNNELAERHNGYDGHISHLVAELLEGANKKIKGLGVEGTLDEEHGVDIQYVNMGDTYNLTILYDGNEGKFIAGTWGDILEKQERECKWQQESESGETKIVSSINLAELVQRLNHEREDKSAWESNHPDTTVREWLDDIAREIQFESYGPLGEGRKSIDLWRINLKGRDESLYYDFIEDKFLSGNNNSVMELKEADFKREMETLDSVCERLNKTCAEKKESDAGKKQSQSDSDTIMEMLKSVREEVGGAEVYRANGGQGLDFYYVCKGNPFRATILFDGHEEKFSVGSWRDLFEEQVKRIHGPKASMIDNSPFYDPNDPNPPHSYIEISTPEQRDNEPFAPESIEIHSNSEPEEAEAQIFQSSQIPAKSILDELDWPKPRSKTEEFRQEFTKKIIGLMEQGEAFWQKPWKCPTEGLPYNAASGRRYNGVNVAYLTVSADKNGFTDPRWMTYKQAQEAGYHVRGGEHGTKIEFYTEYDPSKTKKGAEVLDKKIQQMIDNGASQEEIEKAMEDQKTLIVKTYTVFNASQIEGIEPLQASTSDSLGEFQYYDRAESIIDNCGVPIRYGMTGASYNKSQDVINMPNREWFSTPEYFYTTVLHEVAHSTGHESRMNRDGLGKTFGSQEYAMEELRAEMASAFVFQEIGIPLSEMDMEEHAQDHAAYTQHWLKSLRNDYKEFYKAVRDAVKIADYTLAYEKKQEKANEKPEITEDTPSVPAASEAAQTTAADPVQAAKSLIGQTAIVTNAQKRKTYTGEILRVSEEYAIQKIGADRGIIHNLNKIANSGERETLMNLFNGDKRVSISYDGEHRASLKTAAREEERESAVTR